MPATDPPPSGSYSPARRAPPASARSRSPRRACARASRARRPRSPPPCHGTARHPDPPPPRAPRARPRSAIGARTARRTRAASPAYRQTPRRTGHTRRRCSCRPASCRRRARTSARAARRPRRASHTGQAAWSGPSRHQRPRSLIRARMAVVVRVRGVHHVDGDRRVRRALLEHDLPAHQLAARQLPLLERDRQVQVVVA